MMPLVVNAVRSFIRVRLAAARLLRRAPSGRGGQGTLHRTTKTRLSAMFPARPGLSRPAESARTVTVGARIVYKE